MKAKILLQTGKKGEAIQLIRSVKSSILLEEKNAILKTLEMDELQIQKTKKSSQSQNYITFPSYAQFHHFPMDANLRRIKVLTARLRQEQMLEVLQHDATHSKLSSNLEVTLEEGKQTIKINLSK